MIIYISNIKYSNIYYKNVNIILINQLKNIIKYIY